MTRSFGSSKRPTSLSGLPPWLLAIFFVFVCVDVGAEKDPYPFQRTERHIESGVRSLQEGRYDDAERLFSQAEATDREDQAVVEYNVGSALLMKANQLKEQQGTQAESELSEEASLLYDRAVSSFNDVLSLSSDPAMRSDAALSQGNAKAQKGDLKAAIESYRNALVENRENHAARRNLMQSLRLLKAQPPQPPSEGDNENNDEQDEEENEEEKDENKKNREKQDQGEEDQSSENEQDQEKEQQPGDEQNQEMNDKKDDSSSQEEDKKKNEAGSQGGDKEKDKEKKKSPADGKDGKPSEQKEKREPMTPKERSKKEAERLLDALRHQEKPLNPHMMRMQTRRRAPTEKNW